MSGRRLFRLPARQWRLPEAREHYARLLALDPKNSAACRVKRRSSRANDTIEAMQSSSGLWWPSTRNRCRPVIAAMMFAMVSFFSFMVRGGILTPDAAVEAAGRFLALVSPARDRVGLVGYDPADPRYADLDPYVASADVVMAIAPLWSRIPQLQDLGKPAVVEGYQTSGKTGSAQKAINGSYNNGKFVASFVGFLKAAGASDDDIARIGYENARELMGL